MKRVVKILFIIGFILSTIGLVKVSYYQLKAQLAQQLLYSSWETSKTNQIDNKPWPWADTWPVFKMDIPRIGLSNYVLKDASGESLAFGPGLMTTNIFPGEKGNSFIAAHKDTHFKNLEQLKINDKIKIVNRTGEQQQFEVDQIKVVDSRLEQPITYSENPRVTLVTCYPFNSSQRNTPFRFLVSGKKIL